MKLSLIFPFLFLICFTVKAQQNTPVNALNGTWVPVHQENGGIPMPKVTYAKQKLIIRDSSYTVIGENADGGKLKLLDNQMDWYSDEGVHMGKHYPGIYKLENDQLIICIDRAGKTQPELLNSQWDAHYFLSVYSREKKP